MAVVQPSTVPATVGVAVAVGVLVADTQAEPFHTWSEGGVVPVSYQVVPCWGFAGALVPPGVLLAGTQAVPFHT